MPKHSTYLARRVQAHQRQRLVGGNGAEVDQEAPLAADHGGQHQSGHHHHGEHVHPYVRPQLCLGLVEETVGRVVHHPGVVHQNAHLAAVQLPGQAPVQRRVVGVEVGEEGHHLEGGVAAGELLADGGQLLGAAPENEQVQAATS